MKKILDIPYYSQYDDVKDEYWKPRACGAVCVKMVLDFLISDKKMSVNEFVFFAKEKGAYGEYGWIHQGLVDVAFSSGVNLQRKEFKSPEERVADNLLNEGIREIVSSLKNSRPVIVSVIKKFSEEKKFHMVVLTGYEKEINGDLKGFYYNDSDYQNKKGKDLFVDAKIFKKYWRRLAIFA